MFKFLKKRTVFVNVKPAQAGEFGSAQLQKRAGDGSWDNVKTDKSGGTFRRVMIHDTGHVTFTDTYVVQI